MYTVSYLLPRLANQGSRTVATEQGWQLLPTLSDAMPLLTSLPERTAAPLSNRFARRTIAGPVQLLPLHGGPRESRYWIRGRMSKISANTATSLRRPLPIGISLSRLRHLQLSKDAHFSLAVRG